MKKTIASILALALCFGITACAAPEPDPQQSTQPTASAQEQLPKETQPVTYTYKAAPMQNAECVYYTPDANVPNSSDPSKVQGKIMVWSQCPNCGEENIGSHAIDPAELDFSMGDTIQYSDTDSCWDCKWDKGVEQFMWTIRVTRTPQ